MENSQIEELGAQADRCIAAGRLSEGVALLAQALKLSPGDVPLHFRYASALHGAHLLQEAESEWRALLERVPALMEAHANLGNVLYDMGRMREAEQSFRKALAHSPQQPLALMNLAVLLETEGRVEEALALMEQALRVRPRHAWTECNLAFMQLRTGDFIRGWRTYEARLRLPQMAGLCPKDIPQWRGEALVGLSILLIAEQGLGDTLQFVRYAPMVVARGAKVILEVQKPLAALLRMIPGVEVIVAGGKRPKVDYFCPLMSLPLAFGTMVSTIPAPIQYLAVEAQTAQRWQAWLDAHCPPGKRRIGLVWAGGFRPEVSSAHSMDRRRSMKLAQFAPLANLPGACFVSLQLQRNPADTSGFPILDPMDGVVDFADTAALIQGLDLVISVDTSVAHLAAAVGRRVWLMSRFDACWRWMRDPLLSPWYPQLRLFRQPKHGDWPSVLDAVTEALRAELDSICP